jgi:hypothetical protein
MILSEEFNYLIFYLKRILSKLVYILLAIRLEKETGEFLIPFSVLGPLHPSGAPPLEPFFPVDKRENGRDPAWSDAFGLPWVVYPDGRSDLVVSTRLLLPSSDHSKFNPVVHSLYRRTADVSQQHTGGLTIVIEPSKYPNLRHLTLKLN